MRVALREEDFGRVLSAGLVLIVVGTVAYSLGAGWSVVDGLYVLVGIGILVVIARRLGMGFITARAELDEAKRSSDRRAPVQAGRRRPGA